MPAKRLEAANSRCQATNQSGAPVPLPQPGIHITARFTTFPTHNYMTHN
jgi:hypothetical protein